MAVTCFEKVCVEGADRIAIYGNVVGEVIE